ncbi:MAG: hypothetical protein B7Z37_06210 [Verrucomicrobia bacterium 12-59-8]|nr:MAG: hypothetical protein B7Z37_06210 [Verrucomicrobia bacterium 12-59-8]
MKGQDYGMIRSALASRSAKVLASTFRQPSLREVVRAASPFSGLRAFPNHRLAAGNTLLLLLLFAAI